MAADQYRRRASEDHQRGAQASDSSIKAGWERVAHEWLALAEQVELFEWRYGNPGLALNCISQRGLEQNRPDRFRAAPGGHLSCQPQSPPMRPARR